MTVSQEFVTNSELLAAEPKGSPFILLKPAVKETRASFVHVSALQQFSLGSFLTLFSLTYLLRGTTALTGTSRC
jgi:hypothetical protein